MPPVSWLVLPTLVPEVRVLTKKRMALFSLALLPLAIVTACVMPRGGPSPDGSPERLGSVIVVDQEDMVGAAGSLTDALIGRVSAMRIDKVASRCPLVVMRGMKTIHGNSDPGIYVDGTRMDDTCALNQVRTSEVVRVEVYPSGFTNRPGYKPHPNGLIIVFLTGGLAVP